MEAPTLELFRGDDGVADTMPVRGVGWVLGWAATLAVLTMSTVVLLAFACQLAAERSLAQAAAAGLREAVCERATCGSVETVVRAQLANHFALDRVTTILLERNGSPLKGAVRPQTGDQLLISLSAPATAVLPRWLQAVTFASPTRLAAEFRL